MAHQSSDKASVLEKTMMVMMMMIYSYSGVMAAEVSPCVPEICILCCMENRSGNPKP